jgi:hypothetical protein
MRTLEQDRMKKLRLAFFAVPIAMLPAILPLILILKYGVDIPFWDEWEADFGGLFVRAHQGQLTLMNFLALHNEHRHVVPRIIYFLVCWATRRNCIAVMLASWFIVCANAAVLMYLSRRTLGLRKGLFTVWLLCNLLIFTPVQHENWLWGMGIVNVIPPALFMATVLIAGSDLSIWRRVGIGSILAVMGTFSGGSGVLCWLLPAIALIWSSSWQELKSKKWALLAWLSGLVLSEIFYFLHYITPTFNDTPREHVTMLGVIRYFLAFLGNSFSLGTTYDPMTTATAIGAIELCVFLAAVAYFIHSWRIRHDQDLCRRMLNWLIVGAFSLTNAAITAYFRAGFGIEQALTLRYVTFSLYLAVALVNLAPIICDDLQRRSNAARLGFWRGLPVVGGTVLLVIQIMTFPGAMNGCRDTNRLRRQDKAALLAINILPENRSLTDYDTLPEWFSEQANVLNEMGFIRPPLIASKNAAMIQETDSQRVSGAQGMMEHMAQNGPTRIMSSGWAIFQHRIAPADAVFLAYEDEHHQPIIFAAATIGAPRNDVANQMGDTNYLLSGWAADFPISRLPNYMRVTTISAWALDSDTGNAFKLDGSVVVNLP